MKDLIPEIVREVCKARERWIQSRVIARIGAEAEGDLTIAQAAKLLAKYRFRGERRIYSTHEELWIDGAYDSTWRWQ